MKKDNQAPRRIKAFWRTTKQRKTLNGSLDRFMTPRVRKLQWRSAVAGQANNRDAPVDPTHLNEDRVRHYLRLATRAADVAGVPRPTYPFEPRDVVVIHTRHRDHGEGLWFRLSDGRVFSDSGEPAGTSVGAYD